MLADALFNDDAVGPVCETTKIDGLPNFVPMDSSRFRDQRGRRSGSTVVPYEDSHAK